jgi:hypothetical protein
MARVYKVLAQAAPGATTDTNLYTVPSLTQAVISTVTITNRDSGLATYRIAIRPAGASISNEHYIAFGATVAGNDTIALTLGITLGATDVITVQASTANCSFNVYGSEIA